MNKYKYIIIFILMSLAWLYPFHYMPWLVAENEFFILLVPFVLLLFFLNKKEIKVNDFSIFIFILFFLSFFQYIFIDYFFLEDIVLIAVYLFFIFLILIFGHFFTHGCFFIYLKLILFLCFLNSLIIFFQYFGVVNMLILEHSGMKRFYGNIGQPNHLSTLFMMGLSASFILYNYKKISIRKLYFFSFLLVVSIFLTGSRTGLLTLFILFFTDCILGDKKELKFKVGFYFNLIFVYFLCVFVLNKNSRGSVKSIDAVINDSRISLWYDSFISILSNPWFGYGFNGVRTSRLFGGLSFKSTYVSSHNIFLDFFLWFGVVGGVAFIIYFFVIIRRIYCDKKNGYIISLLLIPFLTHCFFEYPFRYLYFLVLVVPIFSNIKGGSEFYIRRKFIVLIVLVYSILLSFIFSDFQKISRGAFLAYTQKCERENYTPIVLDLMKMYSELYCEELNSTEMSRVIHRYAYPNHIRYYINSGYFDINFIRFEHEMDKNNKK
ncbi:O-antigen ligase family protein [Acinetobacter vivianii]|uniref:O-antigen ligase family protein n=1 Tax=Acinetobacter vivianii TaxID=1776742 RepID=UPI002DB84AE4|nr:O-antigen ligase family protein [Acinetobacter vivianii]MEB6479911.1 O-antigen ligase family protein [Acinetobacter vivianii]MEB6658327.1 O-antigen ligase family protein [Acinetobacter vivianii]